MISSSRLGWLGFVKLRLAKVIGCAAVRGEIKLMV